VKSLAESDLTLPAKTIEEVVTGPLTATQRMSPAVKRMDIKHRIYRRRFNGMRLSKINRVPFKDCVLPREFTVTLRGEPFLPENRH